MKTNKTKILVTGANGLLGVNTILELLNLGYSVIGFLRNKNSFKAIKHKNLELIEGNITNVESLNKTMFGVDCVIHTAAITDQNILEYDEYYKVNVDGVKNIVSASIKNKVRRIIYVSTASEFGHGDLGNLGNEHKATINTSYYTISKKEASEFLRTKKSEIEIIILNPTFMIGAYDTKPSSGKIILMGLRNKFVLCPPGGKNFVCVKDVAKGIAYAINDGANGESYLLANENLSFTDFFKMLRTKSKKRFFIIKLPKELLFMLGFIGSFFRNIGIKTQFSIENMKELCVNSYYSNEKAKSEMNISFSSIKEGVDEAIHWFSMNSLKPR